jgi:bacteriocin biosynthesis cyclodehydratase domain-containing protein
MALQIDSRYPVLWRTPDSVQIGADHAIVTLTGVTVAEEYLLAVLRRGISRSGLSMIGESVGATPEQVADFLERVRPALRSEPTQRARLDERTIEVVGTGLASDAARSILSGLGATISAAGERPELAVLVSTFEVDPRVAGSYLRRDIPHLAVVFGDSEVRIGPLVEPGAGPCLHCVSRARADRDAAWPALASQLYGRPAATEDALTVAAAGPIVTRAVLDRLTAPPSSARAHRLKNRVLTLDAASGRISEARFRPHQECACQEVPPAEIVTAGAAVSDRVTTPSTRAPAARVPA